MNTEKRIKAYILEAQQGRRLASIEKVHQHVNKREHVPLPSLYSMICILLKKGEVNVYGHKGKHVRRETTSFYHKGLNMSVFAVSTKE